MRILHLVNHVRCVGNGIVNVVVDLACTQAGFGHDIAVASAGGEYETLLEAHRVSCFRLPQRLLRPGTLLPLPVRYRRLVGEFRPEVVHVHMSAGLVLAKVFRRRGEYLLVSHLQNEFEWKAILMGWADVVIAVSQATARSAIRRGIPPHKLRVILNGTVGSVRPAHTPKEQTPSTLSLEGRPVVCVSGLNERRGVHDLIAAFSLLAPRFPDAHLYLIGDGPDRDRFETLAAGSNASRRIHFLGFRPNPRDYMAAGEVFVNASYRDPCGQANIEAMESGCPVVATAVDGTPEVLGYGRAGLLVVPGDHSAMAEAIGSLLADASERGRLRAAAREQLPKLTIERVARETLALYQEGLQRCRQKQGSQLTSPACG